MALLSDQRGGLLGVMIWRTRMKASEGEEELCPGIQPDCSGMLCEKFAGTAYA